MTIFAPSRAIARSTAANFGLRATMRSIRFRKTVRARKNAIVAAIVAPIATTMLPPTIPNSAPAPRVHLRKLRPKKEDVRRPEDPHQQNDERSRGTVARSHCTLSNVKGQSEFADDEKERSERGTKPDLAPFDVNVGEKTKDHREQHGDHAKGNDQLNGLP